VIKKEAEMILKHNDPTIEIQSMWNVTAQVMPVTIWATGNISKWPTKYLSNITGKHEIKELHKNSHIVHCTHTAGSAHVTAPNTCCAQ
jgi:hypothetical protein